MSYKSMIELITSQYCSSIEGAIYQSVLNVGINVDKEELLRALEYDRGQYQKGYDDRDAAIVRCKDCKFHDAGENKIDAWDRCRLHKINTSGDEYCSWGTKGCETE